MKYIIGVERHDKYGTKYNHPVREAESKTEVGKARHYEGEVYDLILHDEHYELIRRKKKTGRVTVPLSYPLRGKKEEKSGYTISKNGQDYVTYYTDYLALEDKRFLPDEMPVRVFRFPTEEYFVFEALKDKDVNQFFYVIYDRNMICVGMIGCGYQRGLHDVMAQVYVEDDKKYLEPALLVCLGTVLDYAKSSGNVARGIARADYFLSKYGDKMFDYDFFHKNQK